jgi:hypothetical protein
MTEFNKRMEQLKTLRKFKGIDLPSATRAASKWAERVGQATANLQRLMTERHIA